MTDVQSRSETTTNDVGDVSGDDGDDYASRRVSNPAFVNARECIRGNNNQIALQRCNQLKLEQFVEQI